MGGNRFRRYCRTPSWLRPAASAEDLRRPASAILTSASPASASLPSMPWLDLGPTERVLQQRLDDGTSPQSGERRKEGRPGPRRRRGRGGTAAVRGRRQIASRSSQLSRGFSTAPAHLSLQSRLRPPAVMHPRSQSPNGSGSCRPGSSLRDRSWHPTRGCRSRRCRSNCSGP